MTIKRDWRKAINDEMDREAEARSLATMSPAYLEGFARAQREVRSDAPGECPILKAERDAAERSRNAWREPAAFVPRGDSDTRVPATQGQAEAAKAQAEVYKRGERPAPADMGDAVREQAWRSQNAWRGSAYIAAQEIHAPWRLNHPATANGPTVSANTLGRKP